MSTDVHGDNTLGTLPQFIADNATQARNAQSWHPKITPYRLAVISTTLCLGTVKAVLTQQGRSIAPITLEWIMGVVLTLVFQICSDYESESRVPSFLSWFFTFDCMDITWNFLSLFSIRRPLYISDELESIPGRNPDHPPISDELESLPSLYPDHPPITLHRILLSSITLLFGMSKAALGYLGTESSTAVTWLDWLLATVIMTIFYVLGLYEFNSANIWAPYFLRDRTSHVIFLNWTIISLLCITGSILLIALCAAGLWATWYLHTFHNIFPSSTFLAYFFEMCFKIIFSSFLMYILAMMTSVLVWVVTYNLPRAVKSVPLQLFRAFRRRIWAGRSLPVRRLDFWEQFRPVFTHIILHLLGVTACVTLSGSSLGLASMMFTPSTSSMKTASEVGLDLVMLIGKIFTGLMGIVGIGLIIPTFMIIRSMIRPFYSYRRPYPPEFYDSFFNLS